MDTSEKSDKNKPSEEDNLAQALNTQQIQTKLDEMLSLFDQLSQTLKEIGGWSQSTLQLFLMEWLRNVAVAKRILLCQLLFIPLFIIFIFSLCVCIGIVAYSLTSQKMVGVGSFLIVFTAVLVSLIVWQKYLLRFVGFKETISQVKEGIDVISKAAKSVD